MKKHLKHLMILGGIIILLILFGVLYHKYAAQFSNVLAGKKQLTTIMEMLRNYTPSDVAIFTLILIIMAAIPGAPSSVFAIASGICFGKLLGFTVSFIGFTIGNIITVLAITKIDGLISSDKHHGLTDRIMKMQHPRIGLIIGYMVPFIPTVMTSIAAVKMNISRWQLITCIIIGSIPASLLYALGGDQLMHQHWSRGIVLILLSILLAVLLVVIFIDRKKIEKKIKTEH